MKTTTVNLLAATVLAAGMGVAAAQDVIIAPEQEVIIRDYVVEHPVDPVMLPGEVAVGEEVPPDVVLYPIESPDMTYSYVVVEDRTLIVEPQTRKVVRILN